MDVDTLYNLDRYVRGGGKILGVNVPGVHSKYHVSKDTEKQICDLFDIKNIEWIWKELPVSIRINDNFSWLPEILKKGKTYNIFEYSPNVYLKAGEKSKVFMSYTDEALKPFEDVFYLKKHELEKGKVITCNFKFRNEPDDILFSRVEVKEVIYNEPFLKRLINRLLERPGFSGKLFSKRIK